jgi:hypothetical protein
LVLIGAVLAVGAAAATLVWRMADVRPTQVKVAAVPVVSDPRPVAEQVVLAAPEAVEPVAEATPEPLRSALSRGTPRYSVLVMPLRQESQDLLGRGPVEAFHAAMIEELRQVPGLALRELGESGQAGAGQADFVLTITSLASRASQAGGVVVSSTDGTTYAVNGRGVDSFVTIRGSEVGPGNTRTFTMIGGNAITAPGNVGNGDPASVLWVETMVEPRQAAVTRFTVSMGGEGMPGQPCTYIDRVAESRANADADGSTHGSGAVAPGVSLVLDRQLTGVNLDMDYGAGTAPPARRSAADPGQGQPRTAECQTPAQLAAAQVETLRLQVFPPDPAFQQQLLARLGEASLDETGQKKAMLVLQMMARDGGTRLDAGTIESIVRFAASQPESIRRSAWATLRWANVSSPALVMPLIETLRNDPDQLVRLVVLAHLEASYSDNPAARNALAGVGREDADPVVRVAARRALYGQAGWREEILAALIDSSLSYEARLAPLIADTPVVPPRQQELRRAALQESGVLRPLVNLIRDQGQNSAHTQATNQVLTLLVSVEDPAVFDLFMQLLRETPGLKRETTVGRDGRSIDMSGPLTGWIHEHRDDPRVLEALADVEPRLRAIFEQSRAANPVVEAPAGSTVDLDLVPANLVERMREVTQKPAPAPPAQ